MTAHFNYKDTLARAERIRWRVEDLIGDGKRLDFTKRFLPESLARTEPVSFLSPREKRLLNQIRAHGYLYTFGLVEEFILPFVMDHTRALIDERDDYRTRALLQFAGEEAKHIHLFKKFREEFLSGFGVACDVIGPPEAISAKVLGADPLAVSLLILGIEWMTQAHYTESVRDDAELDPLFKSLLKHHWMEEMQHAQLDSLMTDAIAASRNADERLAGVRGYLELGAFLDGGLAEQAKMDLDALERAAGRRFDASERAEIVRTQHQALRWTFIGSGLVHPQTKAALHRVSPQGAKEIADVAPAFC
ncbi:MAG: hypothetical protein HXY21_08095 [Parvularculaceae bacterium]|nr:hypothetical protein [Parvularculaceae bacterium]